MSINAEFEIDIDDEFGKKVVAMAAQSPSSCPRVFYNADGDSIEILLSNEGYKGERIDRLVTVYRGRESGDVVGGVIKGVKRFVHEYLKESPGFAIDIQDGHIRLACLFTAGMWKQGDKVHLRAYQKLRDESQYHNLAVEVPELAECC